MKTCGGRVAGMDLPSPEGVRLLSPAPKVFSPLCIKKSLRFSIVVGASPAHAVCEPAALTQFAPKNPDCASRLLGKLWFGETTPFQQGPYLLDGALLRLLPLPLSAGVCVV